MSATVVYFFLRGNPVRVAWEGELPRQYEFVNWQRSGGISNGSYRVEAVSWSIGDNYNSVTIMLTAV